MPNPLFSPPACACCGNKSYISANVLWPDLIEQWQLSEVEVAYVNRQQGTSCEKCGNNLRSIALAKAILSVYESSRPFIRFAWYPKMWLSKILELNTAGTLTRYLSKMPRRTLGNYPKVDMQNMSYPNNHFDLVVHSDTLEHVPDPLLALKECCRVLKPGGFCCYTIPIVVNRRTKSRAGMPPSYHGSESDSMDDFIVQTEYGSDFWNQVFEAGFSECRIVTAEYPSAQAIAAQKPY